MPSPTGRANRLSGSLIHAPAGLHTSERYRLPKPALPGRSLVPHEASADSTRPSLGFPCPKLAISHPINLHSIVLILMLGETMRTTGFCLLGLSALLYFVADDWWFRFYAIEIRQAKMIFGAPFNLSDYNHCFYVITKPCDSLMNLSRLGGGSPYHPLIIWVCWVCGLSGITLAVRSFIKAAPTS